MLITWHINTDTIMNTVNIVSVSSFILVVATYLDTSVHTFPSVDMLVIVNMNKSCMLCGGLHGPLLLLRHVLGVPGPM